ncbi:MAG TPA: NADPH-dependent glutamate synthase [Elusimicrobiota bacterium]|nr:NADPH-dependent glutamate synthase [Elusimicrobiota bacterium]
MSTPSRPRPEPGRIHKISMDERKTSFTEVSRGFPPEEAVKEAARCLQCKNAPCSKGCPAGIDVREFVRFIREQNFQSSIDKIRESNSLPGVCGRVCPQEEQCQKACVFNAKKIPIQIGYLERFVADWELAHGKRQPARSAAPKEKVAVIGAGPAGLTCAADLVREGFDVHLFEALHVAGGVLMYGIPEFRLPKDIVKKEADYIGSMGVKIETDAVVGRTYTIDELRRDGYKAFFIGVGAGLPILLNIPGENANGVYSANEFLTRVNLMKGYRFPEYDTPVRVGKRVGVLGGGNVALDCARSALRLGAESVTLLYRRTRDEMPARQEEIENTEEEGIHLQFLVTPREILSDDKGNVRGLRLLKNVLGEPDASGRRSPVPQPGTDFELPLDTVIVAVGTAVNPLLLSTMEGLERTKKGYIKVGEDMRTSLPDVFAGGDIVSGSATVILAIQQARTAARAITHYLRNGK